MALRISFVPAAKLTSRCGGNRFELPIPTWWYCGICCSNAKVVGSNHTKIRFCPKNLGVIDVREKANYKIKRIQKIKEMGTNCMYMTYLQRKYIFILAAARYRKRHINENMIVKI